MNASGQTYFALEDEIPEEDRRRYEQELHRLRRECKELEKSPLADGETYHMQDGLRL